MAFSGFFDGCIHGQSLQLVTYHISNAMLLIHQGVLPTAIGITCIVDQTQPVGFGKHTDWLVMVHHGDVMGVVLAKDGTLRQRKQMILSLLMELPQN